MADSAFLLLEVWLYSYSRVRSPLQVVENVNKPHFRSPVVRAYSSGNSMMLLFCIIATPPFWRFRTRFLFISLLVSPATCTPSGR